MKYFVYIVRCKDDSLYTGISWNIKKRIHQHNYNKRGAKSLRGKLPVKLVYYEKFDSKAKALKRELEIKSWRKERKENLIKCANFEYSEELALKSVAKSLH